MVGRGESNGRGVQVDWPSVQGDRRSVQGNWCGMEDMSDWMSVHDWMGVDNRCRVDDHWPGSWLDDHGGGLGCWRCWRWLDGAGDEWGIGRVRGLGARLVGLDGGAETVGVGHVPHCTGDSVRIGVAVGTDLVVAFVTGLFVADAGAELVRRVVIEAVR